MYILLFIDLAFAIVAVDIILNIYSVINNYESQNIILNNVKN